MKQVLCDFCEAETRYELAHKETTVDGTIYICPECYITYKKKTYDRKKR